MNARIALLMGGAALSLLPAGCGGNHGGYMPPAPPSMSTTLDLDTAAVLVIIQTKTSEIAEPFAVDNGDVAVTPVGDETSAPLSVDAT